jgi:hypothetical protein
VGIAPARWHDVPRAFVELALARLRLARLRAGDIHALGEGGQAPLDVGASLVVARVCHVIPRVAARLPWRADCLVQALAARRWLAAEGIASRLELGARPGDGDRFAAHAWLSAGGRVVLGGDVTGYGRFGVAGAGRAER